MELSSALIFILVVILISSILLIFAFVRADGDLTLMFYEKWSPNPSFTDQVVWITGASSGIGEYLAYDFATRHAKLVLSGVDVAKLENVKKNCIEMYNMKEADVLLLPFLIDNFSVHEESVEKVIDNFGQVDILVNNAGVSQRADFQDVAIEVDQQLFNVNVFGTVNLTRKVLKHMLSRHKGHIIVTSSMAGKIGVPFSSAYTGSKHALHGYFECLRTELTQENIDVTIACPGPVFSGLRRRCFSSKPNERYDEGQATSGTKMETDRCSYLMTIAIANKLSECWICTQPLLILFYFTQYTPAFFKCVLMKMIFDRKKFEEARSGKRN